MTGSILVNTRPAAPPGTAVGEAFSLGRMLVHGARERSEEHVALLRHGRASTDAPGRTPEHRWA